MIIPPVYLGNHLAVVEAFGRWPSFHDAALLSFQENVSTFECEIHAWNLTPELDEKGFLRREKHHRVKFRFDGCTALSLQGLHDCEASFGQNILGELRFSSPEEWMARSTFEIAFESAVGQEFSGALRAREGVVLSVQACDDEGALL